MDVVETWEGSIVIPTYEAGEADKNPMSLESRVHQGSSGKIYPYLTTEKISDGKKDKVYQVVWLENEYLKVMVLPELGGRMQRACNKTNQYDLVYYNHVTRPALVRLCEPWISGGIEFNWPQHHRPTTFLPVGYMLIENGDGSKTCRICDVNQMYGTRGEASFTLYSGKAYIEIRGQLYNRTVTPQTFLWWANSAVLVNGHTQSVFPPDVRVVVDHGKRDVSRFPITTEEYYKHDYSEGAGTSRYKNIPVPTPHTAEKSEFSFVGGYDYQKQAGIFHAADHHIPPGKRQWAWGCEDFGKAWGRNLTDEDEPYIELMTGVYTDDQPDSIWPKPMEEKTFTQYSMPYKAAGAMKNASIHMIINLDVKEERIRIIVYGTREYPQVRILLTYGNKILLDETTKLFPVRTLETIIHTQAEDETGLTLRILDREKELVAYRPLKKEISKLPEPAEASKVPEEIMTVEKLYLTRQHIEQYRYATYRPDPYYPEALKCDPGDSRTNDAYGSLLLRRGCFKEAERYFRRATRQATWKNPNPYQSEPYYNLGLTLLYQSRTEDASDTLYKVTWSNEQQEMSFYYLARIEAGRGNYEEAMQMVDKGLVRNSHNVKTRGFRAYLLRKIGKTEQTVREIAENLAVDPFGYVSRMERSHVDGRQKENLLKEFSTPARNFHENRLMTARDYVEFGAYEEVVTVLPQCSKVWPMLFYYKAYYLGKMGKDISYILLQASQCSTDYRFPNKPEDIPALECVAREKREDANAYYYLGNLYYDKMQYDTAIGYWERLAELNPDFAIARRNLSLVYYNKRHDPDQAEQAMKRVYELNPGDARIFLELDQLYKKLGMSVAEQLRHYDMARDVFMQRDDLMIEYAVLLNLSERYGDTYEFIMVSRFHPWEGGEGKAIAQYTVSLVELTRSAMERGDLDEAEEFLKKALCYPENLEEDKLEGCKDNHVNYYLGIIKGRRGDQIVAEAYFEKISVSTGEPAGMMYYNDQSAGMIYYQGPVRERLNRPAEAKARPNKPLDYEEQHIFDVMRVSHFAVSPPDFLIFDGDLNKRNQAYCYYLIGPANLGLGNVDAAAKAFVNAVGLEPTHQNVIRYLHMTGKA